MRFRLIVCVVLLLLLGGCGTPAPTSTAQTSTAPTSATTSGAPGVLDFRGSTVAGGTFDGADLAGKPVVLWFWAPY